MILLDPTSIIKTVGYLGVFAIIFAESGLLVGFFLPGDSLLFTAGFLASQGVLHLWILIPIVFVAAVIGDSTGYSIGKKLGPKIFTRKDSFLFRKSHLHQANEFFQKHGGKTIVLARFVPVVRTFVPVLAGVGLMKYRTFLSYNVIGGALWAIGLTLGGYFLGRIIPNADKYLLPLVAVIIVISILPGVVHVLRSASNRAKIISYIKK